MRASLVARAALCAWTALSAGCGRRTAAPAPPEARPAADAPEVDRSRIPPFNEPLFPGGNDPIASDNGPVRRRVGDGLVLDVSTPTSNVVYPRPVTVVARLDDRGSPAQARLSGSLARSAPGSPRERIEAVFRDDGQNGDAQAGDRVYTWQLAPSSPQEAARWAGMHDLDVLAEAGSRRVRAQIGWQYGGPAGGELTGQGRSALREGSLVIELQARFSEPGRYHLQLSLYAPDDTPVAWAQAPELFVVDGPGERWLPVVVHGSLLTQRRVPGPYVVRWAWLRNVSQMPARTASLGERLHTTAPVALDQLSDQPYREPPGEPLGGPR